MILAYLAHWMLSSPLEGDTDCDEDDVREAPAKSKAASQHVLLYVSNATFAYKIWHHALHDAVVLAPPERRHTVTLHISGCASLH